jgi:uncharacterized protein (TIGR03083 family)
MDYLAILTDKLAEYDAALGAADLAAPVPSCGDWTVYDLTDHHGRGNHWVATAVHDKNGGGGGEALTAPTDPVAIRAWFRESVTAITSALAADPETVCWTFTTQAPQTVGFWRRRRAQETVMHLWDLRDANGLSDEDNRIDPAFAADGVDEVFELFARRMILRGLAAEPAAAVRLTATDTGDTWVYGPGEPVAELSATAGDLLLALWNRKPRTGADYLWDGDEQAGLGVLAGPLVP